MVRPTRDMGPRSILTYGLGGTPTAAPFPLDDLTDVDAPSPTDGQALIWDAGASEWVPGDAASVLTVEDGVTSVSPVDTIVFDGSATVTDDTGGQVTVTVTGGGGGSFVGAKAYHNTTQVITSASGGAAVAFNSEDFDSGSIHDNSTNNSRFTVPTTGYYTCIYHNWLALAVTADYHFRVNGTTTRSNVLFANVAGMSWTMSTLLALTAGDYVELFCIPQANITLGHASVRHAQVDFSIAFEGA